MWTFCRQMPTTFITIFFFKFDQVQVNISFQSINEVFFFSIMTTNETSYRNIQHSLCYKRWMTNTRTCSVPSVPSWNNANTKKKKLVDEINPWMQLVTVMPSAREWMGCCDFHALWLEGSPPATKLICFLIHSITAVFLSFSFWVCFCVRCFCFL